MAWFEPSQHESVGDKAMKTFGVGIFGIGWVAGEHVKALTRNPNMQVTALASHKRESAQAKKDELGLDCDILDDYEALLAREDVAHHPFQGMMDDLATALLEDREATANIHEAYKSHEICLAIDRSIETGRAVKLPLAQ